jgi:hypothetical protein
MQKPTRNVSRVGAVLVVYQAVYIFYTRGRESISRTSSVVCIVAPLFISPGAECCGMKSGANNLGRWRGIFFWASLVLVHTNVSSRYTILLANISFQPHWTAGCNLVNIRQSRGNWKSNRAAFAECISAISRL